MVDCRNWSCTRLQPNEFVFGCVPKDHRNHSNRISPESAATLDACEKRSLRMQNASVTPRGAMTYFAEIRRIPMLKPEEEFILAARWRERGDGGASHRLLTSHLRL